MGLRNRSAFGLPHDRFLFSCLQSVFKLHPSFDPVIRRVLEAVPNADIVFIEVRSSQCSVCMTMCFMIFTSQGRRHTWTSILQARLRRALGSFYARLHFVPRVPGSQPFLRLLSCMDAVLHPYPFGGSKTAADVIALGLPLVVMTGR